LEGVEKDKDVLLVVHAATAVALRHLFKVENDNRAFHWNCHLSLLYATDEKTYTSDVSHLPEEMWTGNSLNYLANKRKFEEQMQEAECFMKANSGATVLHISDTHSGSYGYYKELIAKINPDVIIHTGDLADELKAGRIENVREYWRETIPNIVRIMENTSARVIIVPGNNDLEDELKKIVKRAEILSRNTVLDLYGLKFLLCHELNRMDESIPADVYLYGHGLTGETRTPDDNVREGKRFYNATWGASLHVPEKNASMMLPKVEI
jgi:predicted phosphodiesterase